MGNWNFYRQGYCTNQIAIGCLMIALLSSVSLLQGTSFLAPIQFDKGGTLIVNSQVMCLGQDSICFLPNEVLNNPFTSTIILRDCQYLDIDQIVDQLRKVKKLDALTITNCNLKKIPNNIQYLTHITKLNLSNNLLHELPDDIRTLKHLKELDVSQNPIGYWSFLSYFKKLCSLRLNHCNIHQLPKELLQLRNLEGLEMNHNFLTELPYAMKNLKKIKYLDVEYNLFSEIPMCIRFMKQLDELYINVKKLQPYKQFPNRIRRLIIKGNEITDVPCGCFDNLSKVEEIWLHELGVTSINACLLDFNPKVRRCRLIFQDCKYLPKDASLGWNKKQNIVVAVGYKRD